MGERLGLGQISVEQGIGVIDGQGLKVGNGFHGRSEKRGNAAARARPEAESSPRKMKPGCRS
jgi:hypothetical protein